MNRKLFKYWAEQFQPATIFAAANALVIAALWTISYQVSGPLSMFELCAIAFAVIFASALGLQAFIALRGERENKKSTPAP